MIIMIEIIVMMVIVIEYRIAFKELMMNYLY